MVGCILNPIYDGLFLMPFDTYQTADAAAFRYEGQRLGDFVFGRVSAIENRPFGFCEGVTTGLTLEALATCIGLAELDDVLLGLTLQLAVIGTDLIWTKIAYLGKL